MIGKGVFYNSYGDIRAYFQDPWDVLDFVVLLIAMVNLYFEVFKPEMYNGTLRSLKVLRILRAVRPLSIINRDDEVKSIFDSIFTSMLAAINMMIFVYLVSNFFILFGMYWFKGTFSS